MHDVKDTGSEWDRRYMMKLSNGESMNCPIRKAAKQCVEQSLTALIFLGDEEVGWVDRAGNSGVRA